MLQMVENHTPPVLVTPPTVTPFGKIIRELRERRGISRRVATELFGVSYRAIQDWESGIYARCVIETLPKIVEALALSPEEKDRLYQAWRDSDPAAAEMQQKRTRLRYLDYVPNFPEIAELESITVLAQERGEPELANKVLKTVERIVNEAQMILRKLEKH